MQGAEARGLTLATAIDFESVTGMGVRATVDGVKVIVGNRKLMEDSGVDLSAAPTEVDAVMFVAVSGKFAGLITVADPIKATTAGSHSQTARGGHPHRDVDR